jgi:hypothetical protein
LVPQSPVLRSRRLLGITAGLRPYSRHA